MAPTPVDLRDQLVARFRKVVCRKWGVMPFRHQAEWWAASEGLQLTDSLEVPGEPWKIRGIDGTEQVLLALPRPHGAARVLADLGAFKSGKSWGAGLWMAGFAAVPDARVQIIGVEYDICAPEFDYLSRALLSSEGMGLQSAEYVFRPREGRMVLVLKNGARFEARSWERRDALKGKEIDAYVYAESYQFPGIEVFTSLAQNLRARQGFAVFATTPDRPWVQIFHERGHGELTDWHCTCGIPSSVNPFTFDQRAMDRDDPLKGGLMTRERFQIAYLGQLGEFVGRVYNYQRGQRQFTTTTHPALWKDAQRGATLENLKIPEGWTIVGGADTGTHSSSGFIAFSSDGDAFVLGEVPNYRYVAGTIELDPQSTVPGWAARTVAMAARLGTRAILWADRNSQFKAELINYGITLLGSAFGPEARTEIAREYFQARKIWLAPWLSVLPFEIELACWPEEATAAGKFSRIKDRDHSLDWMEHILAHRPLGKRLMRKTPGTWAASMGYKLKQRVDQHLGRR